MKQTPYIPLSLSIQDAGGAVLAHAETKAFPLPHAAADEGSASAAPAHGAAEAAEATGAPVWLNLVYAAEYAEGDTITLTARAHSHLVLQLDDALEPAVVYLSGERFTYPIPFAEKKLSYNPKTFSGSTHLLRARVATSAEIAQYRNLALNSHDCATNSTCFPHASANIETRGESVFAARNAINGNTVNTSHGAWPYESWGINRDPNAALYLDFGRAVTIDRLVLVTRADFPHDSWWKEATVTFSDGSSLVLPMQKSYAPHVFTFAPKTVTALTLQKLIKSEEDDSPFPALTQLEVYGHEANA